jgi:hypothetical protein
LTRFKVAKENVYIKAHTSPEDSNPFL